MFTGSGFPQRFADDDGSLIDVYQATTQLTDESEIDYLEHITTLLDNALGDLGYYGVFTTNMHTDRAVHEGADIVVAAAKARGVPVISAAQMLEWLDGRNDSAFKELSMSNGSLRFVVAPGSGARGLEAMVPIAGPRGALTLVTQGGAPVTTTIRTVKGIDYAVFPATAGEYVATYAGGGDGRPVDVTPPETTIGNGPSPAARPRSPSRRARRAPASPGRRCLCRLQQPGDILRPGRRPAHVCGAGARRGRQRRPDAGHPELHRREQRRGVTPARKVSKPSGPGLTARARAPARPVRGGPDAAPAAPAAPRRPHAGTAHRFAARRRTVTVSLRLRRAAGAPDPRAEHASRGPGDDARRRRSPLHQQSKDPPAGAARQMTDHGMSKEDLVQSARSWPRLAATLAALAIAPSVAAAAPGTVTDDSVADFSAGTPGTGTQIVAPGSVRWSGRRSGRSSAGRRCPPVYRRRGPSGGERDGRGWRLW